MKSVETLTIIIVSSIRFLYIIIIKTVTMVINKNTIPINKNIPGFDSIDSTSYFI
jgi:hypothetical protein